jgi:hypothetical protein
MKMKKAGGRVRALAKKLFKEAWPADGRPPQHWSDRRVEKRISRFYEKYEVDSISDDAIRLARQDLE